MAGRASVEFYVGLALKGRAETLANQKDKTKRAAEGGITEDAFVIRTFRNGVGVFVFECVLGPRLGDRFCSLSALFRLGLEGLVTFKRDVQFDADNYTVVVPAGDAEPVAISVFDKVKVRIEVEKDKNTQRGRVKMSLVSPVDSRGL